MDAINDCAEVEVQYIKVRCRPKRFPCPTCGKRGRRKGKLNRQVRTIAYQEVVYLDIDYAEYRSRCGCCKTFCSTPENLVAVRRKNRVLCKPLSLQCPFQFN